jgi:SAM-dependent methyltransferase
MLVNRAGELGAALAALIDRRMAEFVEMLGEKPRHWLEIGPGSGLLSAIAANHGGTWRGVEIDQEMAADMIARGLDVIQGDFSSMEPRRLFLPAVAGQGGFDIIFLSQVLEHVCDPARFLVNARAALRPGGIIYLDVPNDGGLTAIVRRLNRRANAYGEVVPPYHMVAYGADTLAYALENAGFERVTTKVASYNDDVYGLAHARIYGNAKLQAVWTASRLLGLGGNLVGMAQRPVNDSNGVAVAC